MDHPTSTWAAWYGLADPGPIADELLGLAPAELAARMAAAAEVARRIEDATGAADDALVLVGAGWSNPAPRGVIAGLANAARQGAQLLTATAATGRRVAAALESLMADVRAAYAEADAAIARQGLMRMDGETGWPLDEDPIAGPLRSARVAVVLDLGARVMASQAAATSVVSDLSVALADDPRAAFTAFRSPAGALPALVPDPAAEDDAANRAALLADLAGPDPIRARFATRVLDALRHAAASAPSGTVVELLSYDPRHPVGQGAAAIAIGDVSTADDVAVLVPGVGNSPAAMDGAVDAAAQLRANAVAAGPGASVAAVAWLGYDLPLSFGHDFPMSPLGVIDDALIALDDADAVDGGRRLADFTSRLRTGMTTSARLTLVGHSYGSVVVSQAATLAGGIDDIVLLAAPGSGPDVHDAADYAAVSPDHVFALSFDHDPITTPVTDVLAALLVPAFARPPGAPFGDDPAAAGFGAQVIDAPTNVPVVTLDAAAALPGGLAQALLVDGVTELGQHPLTNYLAGAAGLAVGAVVVGRYTAVRTRRGR